MTRPYRDREWLKEHYIERDMSERALAEMCGVSPRTIDRWLKRHGFKEEQEHQIGMDERMRQIRKRPDAFLSFVIMVKEGHDGTEFHHEYPRTTSPRLPVKVRAG